jgi:hypothetical protein
MILGEPGPLALEFILLAAQRLLAHGHLGFRFRLAGHLPHPLRHRRFDPLGELQLELPLAFLEFGCSQTKLLLNALEFVATFLVLSGQALADLTEFASQLFQIPLAEIFTATGFLYAPTLGLALLATAVPKDAVSFEFSGLLLEPASLSDQFCSFGGHGWRAIAGRRITGCNLQAARWDSVCIEPFGRQRVEGDEMGTKRLGRDMHSQIDRANRQPIAAGQGYGPGIGHRDTVQQDREGRVHLAKQQAVRAVGDPADNGWEVRAGQAEVAPHRTTDQEFGPGQGDGGGLFSSSANLEPDRGRLRTTGWGGSGCRWSVHP